MTTHNLICHSPLLVLYPVQPVELAIPLGFTLGNAVERVIHAPYVKGARDCTMAQIYLGFERELPQPMMPAPYYFDWRKNMLKLQDFFARAQGDALWKDIAVNSSGFLESLNKYLVLPSDEFLDEMEEHIRELSRVLSLRDTTGQIYEGMTGLPQKPEEEGE